MNFTVETDPTKLYAPLSSPAVADSAFQDSTFGYQDRRAAFVVVPIDKGNALAKNALLDFFDLYHEIAFDRSAVVDDREYKLKDLCRKTGTFAPWDDQCHMRSILQWWNYNRTQLSQDSDVLATLSTSVEDYMGSSLSLTSVASGVVYSASNTVVSAEALRIDFWLVNNASIDTVEQENPKWTCTWEEDLGKFYTGTMHGSLAVYPTQLWCYTTFVMFHGFYEEIWLMVADYALMIAFASFVMSRNSWVSSKATLAAGAVLSVLLAVMASFGLGSGMGMMYSTVIQLLVFLLLGLGIDDAFVIVQTHRQSRGATPREHVGETMSVAGASITITSLTDCVAFLSGLTNSLPVIRSLCVFGALGVAADWGLQVTLFVVRGTEHALRLWTCRGALSRCSASVSYCEPECVIVSVFS